MLKWAFLTVGPITKVYTRSSSLVDNNKIHWRKRDALQTKKKKERARAEENKVWEFWGCNKWLQWHQQHQAPIISLKITRNLARFLSLHVLSLSLNLMKNSPTNPVLTKLAEGTHSLVSVSLSIFSLTRTNTNIDKEIKFLIWSNFAFYILKGNRSKEQRISSCWSHLQLRVHF